MSRRRHRHARVEPLSKAQPPPGLTEAPDSPGREGRRARPQTEANGSAQRIGRLIDPWQYWSSMGVSLRKPGPITFDTLRQIAHGCEPISAIVQTRQNQVAAFASYAEAGNKSDPGWRIVMKDEKKAPGDSDLKRIQEVKYFFEHGHADVPDEVTTRLRRGLDYPEENFEGFLRKIVRDRLILDAVACEKTRTRDDKLFSLWALDAARIWRAFPKEAKDDGPTLSAAIAAATWMQEREHHPNADLNDVDFVQEYRGREWVGWPRKDFLYAYANPRTDMGCYGYGYSELEMLVSIVTAILNAVSYNKSQFTTSSLPPGFLSLFGAWDETMVEGLKREFQNRLQGPTNQNRLPVLWSQDVQGARGAEWIAMRGANREMEYHQWLDWLLNIGCAVYQIAPDEIGIRSYGGGDSAPMFDKGPMAQLKHSKDKGLKPLLRFLAGILSHEVVSEFYDDLAFQFVNIEPEDESVKTDLMTKRLSAGYETVNMARAKNDEPKIEESWADAPPNAALLQVWMQERQMQQQQAQMGEESPADQQQGYNRFLYDPEDGAAPGAPPPGAPAGGANGNDGERAQQAQAAPGAPQGAPNLRKALLVPRQQLLKALQRHRFHRLRVPVEEINRDVAAASSFFEEGG